MVGMILIPYILRVTIIGMVVLESVVTKPHDTVVVLVEEEEDVDVDHHHVRRVVVDPRQTLARVLRNGPTRMIRNNNNNNNNKNERLI